MENTKGCSGCRNDFYNGHNDLGVAQCWSVDSAKVVQRFRLPIDIPMNIKRAYVKVKLPDCYHKNGFVFLPSIPAGAK